MCSVVGGWVYAHTQRHTRERDGLVLVCTHTQQEHNARPYSCAAGWVGG
jgi:hypothetical protein